MNNIDKYKKDIEKLVNDGQGLYHGLSLQYRPELMEGLSRKTKRTEAEIRKAFPSFIEKYQIWYSEALECLRQLLPSRVDDFISYYKPLSKREKGNISYENYTISDCLNRLAITRGWDKEKIVGPEAAIPKFRQQLAIIESLNRKFESSLFDIRTLLQSDLFDHELEAAEELAKKGFLRAAGAVAGVVLESHLKEICNNHKIEIKKKDPTIGDYNDALKSGGVIDIPVWRNIQLLADIRNLCDHKKDRDPKKEEIDDLISGVRKVSKTVF